MSSEQKPAPIVLTPDQYSWGEPIGNTAPGGAAESAANRPPVVAGEVLPPAAPAVPAAESAGAAAAAEQVRFARVRRAGAHAAELVGKLPGVLERADNLGLIDLAAQGVGKMGPGKSKTIASAAVAGARAGARLSRRASSSEGSLPALADHSGGELAASSDANPDQSPNLPRRPPTGRASAPVLYPPGPEAEARRPDMTSRGGDGRLYFPGLDREYLANLHRRNGGLAQHRIAEEVTRRAANGRTGPFAEQEFGEGNGYRLSERASQPSTGVYRSGSGAGGRPRLEYGTQSRVVGGNTNIGQPPEVVTDGRVEGDPLPASEKAISKLAAARSKKPPKLPRKANPTLVEKATEVLSGQRLAQRKAAKKTARATAANDEMQRQAQIRNAQRTADAAAEAAGRESSPVDPSRVRVSSEQPVIPKDDAKPVKAGRRWRRR